MEFGCLRDNNIMAVLFKYLCFSQKDKYYKSMLNKEENKDVLIQFIWACILRFFLKFIYNSKVSDSLTSLIYEEINLVTTTSSY